MPIDANSQSEWSTPGASSRQKRVLPSRSRRGGPGLGHCEVDNLILETQKRKLENEPLIPGDTPFLLTTNPKYAEEASNDSESGIQINVVANDRYFDRPDVLKAFREQAVIQTPEYEAISESISGVGGRFRPRNQEEAVAETSDAAYEKRHRKFENFEKRQRLREKEKLKHEHYKLKERIEQLRAMDGSTFMTLPPSAFTLPPQGMAEEVDETTNSPYVSLNGGIHFVEGERRRKEMLDVAIMLEKRYAYLLPPRKVPEASSLTLKDTEGREYEETDFERDSGVPASKKDKAPKPRTQSVKSSGSSTPAQSPASSRPLISRKPWFTLTPEAKRPSRGHRTSISTFAEAPDLLPVEEKEEPPSSLIVVENDRLASQPLPPPRSERSPSPIVVVDDIPETDRLPSQPPPSPTPIQSVRDEESPSPHNVDVISEDDTLPTEPPPPPIQSVRDGESPSPQGVDDISEGDTLPPQPLPTPPPIQSVRVENSPSPLIVGDIPEDDRLSSQSPPPILSQSTRNEKAPSPDIVVDDIPENEELPSQPPPPTLQSVPNDVGAPDIYSPEFQIEKQLPLTVPNGTQPADYALTETSDENRAVDVEVSQPQPEPSANMACDMDTEVEALQPQPEPSENMACDMDTEVEALQPQPEPSCDMNTEVEALLPQPEPSENMAHDMDTENLDLADGESEGALLAAENVEVPKRMGSPGKSVDTKEVEVETAETITEPMPTGEPEEPQKQRKGWWRRRKRKTVTVQGPEPESLPEIRVKRRVLPQEMAGPSRVMDEPEVVSGIRIEEIPVEVGLTDSISNRPVKRRRMDGVVLVPESVSAAPPADFDSGISATSLSVRGKTYVSYVDSRTGEKVRTPSLLMVACMRAVEKAHSRRVRETASFGAPTPDFGKGAIVDYELWEEILYRDFRDRSLDPSGSLVTSAVVDEEGSEQEEADSSDEDNDTEEGQTEGETEDDADETEDEADEKADGTEDEKELVNRQSSEVQLSNERNKRIESEHSVPESAEPQSGRDQNHRGIKLTEQGHYSRYGNRFLVYQGPSDEQLVASPEAEPMPELPPGVRPREPSRRHCDLDEELIWD